MYIYKHASVKLFLNPFFVVVTISFESPFKRRVNPYTDVDKFLSHCCILFLPRRRVGTEKHKSFNDLGSVFFLLLRVRNAYTKSLFRNGPLVCCVYTRKPRFFFLFFYLLLLIFVCITNVIF